MTIRPAMVWCIAAALAVMVEGCGGAAARKGDPADQTATLSARDIATVTRTDLGTGVPVQGALEPSLDVSIIAPYPELIDRVMVKEGQTVRRGQVLARFRTESLEPAAASAEAQRRISATDYERMKNLLREGAVSQRDVDNAEAALKSVEAGAAAARNRLDDANVKAPFAGMVATRFVQSGDRVGDGDRLFRVVNTDELEFAASVPTEALALVRPGAPVSLTVSGLGGAALTGRVARVNSTVDAATRQVKVYVVVPNRVHRLAGDMFATGRVLLETTRATLAAPANGVRSDAGGASYVWVLAGGRIDKRPVKTGVRDEARDLVEMIGGVREGDSLVVGPIEGLSPGQAVEIAADANPAATGTVPPAGAAKAGGKPAGAGRK